MEGAEGSSPESEGVVRRRRQSDWTGEPRAADEAAESAYRAALGVATATLAAYDGGTASHSDDVVTLCLALADELGVEDRQRRYLLAAAELHDIGKVAVPARILSKPAPLDDGEWEVVREHTLTGQRILSSVPELVEVARIVRHCHERFDGRGYPDGLAGEQIPLAARIVFCADAFHAIRGDRPYRRGRSARAALTEVERHAGTQFDPAVVEALTRVAGRMRRQGFGASAISGGRRSQRLAALLLALVVGGSALAASGVWSPGGSEASTKPFDRESGQAQPAERGGGAGRASGAGRAGGAGGAERAGRAGSPAARSAEQSGTRPANGPALAGGMRSRSSSPSSSKRDRAAPSPPVPGPRAQQRGSGPAQPPRTPAGSGQGGPTPPAPVRDRRPQRGRPAPAPRAPAVPPAPAPVPAPPAEDDDGHEHGNGNGHDKGRGNGHGKGHEED